jgi:hypothetical protein
VNDPPIVSNIPDQTINQGGSFATLDLDDYVTDVDNTLSEITWDYSGNTDLTVNIDSDHIVTITIPTDWFGAETITFTATDPGMLSDSDDATFTVIGFHSIFVKTHWNLISLPVYDTISKDDIIVHFGLNNYTWDDAVTNNYVLDTIYDWLRDTQGYNAVDTLEPGNGYWMWAYVECELRISSNAIAPGSKPITDLQDKWNIMGIPYESSLVQTNLKVNWSGTNYSWADAVSSNIILGFIYGWDNMNQMYILQTTFLPGQGYWMYAYSDCKLYRGD